MTFSIVDPRMAVHVGDTVVADETLKPGNNGNFDARLIQRAGGVLDIEVFLKLQFFFVDAEEWEFEKEADRKWTAAERQHFMREWHRLVRGHWSRKNVGRIGARMPHAYALSPSNGDAENTWPVNVTFNFLIKEGGWMWDHFEIDVHKVQPETILAGFGSVMRDPVNADVRLDSNAVVPWSKEKVANVQSLLGLPSSEGYHSACHEFGHMIGLGEDYKHPIHSEDYKSVMHSGPEIRPRHYNYLMSWAAARLRSTGG